MKQKPGFKKAHSWTKLFRINPDQDSLRLTVATYVFQINSWKKAQRNIESSESRLNNWSASRYVLPGLLKKPTDNERRPKTLKKPVAKDRADNDYNKKCKNKPKCNFHG